MLVHAARVVNSTPLFDPPEDPNDPEPITPHRLITQRDDTCKEDYSRPTVHSAADLAAYGANRWKRVEAIADEFSKYWKHYMYHIGSKTEKWTEPKRNAAVGDRVLMKDKGLPRLGWSTATITHVTRDRDDLVRRIMVHPGSRHDKSTTQALRDVPSTTWSY